MPLQARHALISVIRHVPLCCSLSPLSLLRPFAVTPVQDGYCTWRVALHLPSCSRGLTTSESRLSPCGQKRAPCQGRRGPGRPRRAREARPRRPVQERRRAGARRAGTARECRLMLRPSSLVPSRWRCCPCRKPPRPLCASVKAAAPASRHSKLEGNTKATSQRKHSLTIQW